MSCAMCVFRLCVFWADPLSMSPQKALETIGANLQKQYENWQPRVSGFTWTSLCTFCHVFLKWNGGHMCWFTPQYYILESLTASCKTRIEKIIKWIIGTLRLDLGHIKVLLIDFGIHLAILMCFQCDVLKVVLKILADYAQCPDSLSSVGQFSEPYLMLVAPPRSQKGLLIQQYLLVLIMFLGYLNDIILHCQVWCCDTNLV